MSQSDSIGLIARIGAWSPLRYPTSAIRALSIGLAVCLLSQPIQFYSVFFAIIFPHYILGFWLSRRALWRALHDRRGQRVFTLSVLTGLGLYFFGVPDMTFFFALHFAFSEVYFLNPPIGSSRVDRILRTSVYLAGYFFFVRSSFLMSPGSSTRVSNYLDSRLSLVVFLTLSIVLLMRHLRRGFEKNQTERDLIVFDLLGISVLLFSPEIEVGNYLIIFYHVNTYLFALFCRRSLVTAQFSIGPDWKMLMVYGLLFGFFLLLTPAVGAGISLKIEVIKNSMYYWGILHVVSTIAGSRFQPKFLHPGQLPEFK